MYLDLGWEVLNSGMVPVEVAILVGLEGAGRELLVGGFYWIPKGDCSLAVGLSMAWLTLPSGSIVANNGLRVMNMDARQQGSR